MYEISYGAMLLGAKNDSTYRCTIYHLGQVGGQTGGIMFGWMPQEKKFCTCPYGDFIDDARRASQGAKR
jgi:hypothetical protein